MPGGSGVGAGVEPGGVGVGLPSDVGGAVGTPVGVDLAGGGTDDAVVGAPVGVGHAGGGAGVDELVAARVAEALAQREAEFVVRQAELKRVTESLAKQAAALEAAFAEQAASATKLAKAEAAFAKRITVSAAKHGSVLEARRVELDRSVAEKLVASVASPAVGQGGSVGRGVGGERVSHEEVLRAAAGGAARRLDMSGVGAEES